MRASFFYTFAYNIFVVDYMVTQPHDIDVSNYAEIPINPSICVTPCAKPCMKKVSTIKRRKRSPMALKLTKVNMVWSDNENDDD